MRKILVAAFLLAAWPAQADMYQDASNPILPAAINNLTVGGMPAVAGPIVLTTGGSINLSASTVKPALTQSPGSMVLTGGGWAINNWFSGGKGGQQAQWLLGSKDNPVTAGGAPVAIGMVQAIPKENCGNNTATTGCNSALLLQNMATSGSTMVSSALTAYAETQSTVGGGLGNAQGINALGVGSATSTAHGMGAYINGTRLGTVGGLRGMEVRGTNASAADCDPAAHDFTSQCTVVNVGMVGPVGGPRRLISSAIQVAAISTLFGGAREGLIFGHNSITEITIADRTDSTTSLLIDGTHATAAIQTMPDSGRLLIGTDASYAGPGGFGHAFQYYARVSAGAGAQFGLHTNDANGTRLAFSKSRNVTVGSHTAVQDGDNLGQLIFSGSDGTSYGISAQIITKVSGAVSAGVVPTRMAFFTTNASGVGVEAMFLSPAGDVGVVGGVVAPALATAGTIAGSLCRTSTGTFIYKAGANCF